MKFLGRLFRRTKARSIPAMPSWKTIIKTMYGKQLDAFSDEIVKVIYSHDLSMRYVILKNRKGLFTYQLEAIYLYNDDQWQYICTLDHALPATWQPFTGNAGHSVFENEDDLLREMKTQPEYQNHFP